MSTPVVNLGLQFRSLSSNIRPTSVTAHYGGPSPWSNHNPSSWDHGRCPTVVKSWHAYHLSKGWSGLAYTTVVCPHGVRYRGRGKGHRTAANGTNSGNNSSYAICGLIGAADPVTDAMKNAFLDEAGYLGVPLNRTHDQWKSTACPGYPLRDWVRAGAPRPGGVTPPPTPKPTPSPKPTPTPVILSQETPDMFIAVEGVGFFAQIGNVTVPLPGIDLVGFAKLMEHPNSVGYMHIPAAAAEDFSRKVMTQTAVATGV